jgi:carbonic anhydrase/acetyltransferase-like protein (isoleucine patch superfamily)
MPLTIGERAVVMASAIGAHIGADTVVGKRCVLGDSCYIDSGAVMPADTTVAPFALIHGNPK